MITCKRVYKECRVCLTSLYPADAAVGITSRYTVGLRRLAVKAGTMSSFDKAAEHLEEFCGIKLSDNTIRDLCQKEAVPMGRWQRTNPAANADFIASKGDVEFTTDGTCVNTTEGWREMRVGIFAKRERGESVHPDQWDDRKLPKPHASVAFAGIENKEQFRKHWNGWARRLGVDEETISVLGDGAHWIWDAATLTFAKRDEVLDVYHGLENISNCGKVLYGSETEAYETWHDETTLELLWNGYELIERRLNRLERCLAGVPAEYQTTEQRGRTPEQTTKASEALEAIRKLRGYLSYHANRLNYRERLAEGKSIGSGQVEGACKNLIGKRLKQTGARWRIKRVSNMATLCAVLYGNQWKSYWNYAK
jgi:hypothetical protein